ncbi:hypothetical protein HDU81_004299 [Chytriomyces hyalinus]|nr:hypothetical protein HDU81_004299 [Chytriomyces hyalinus]
MFAAQIISHFMRSAPHPLQFATKHLFPPESPVLSAADEEEPALDDSFEFAVLKVDALCDADNVADDTEVDERVVLDETADAADVALDGLPGIADSTGKSDHIKTVK